MDPLSPESRALYEILMADTAEIYKSKFAAYRKDRLDTVKQFAVDARMRSTTPPRAPSGVTSVTSASTNATTSPATATSASTSPLVSRPATKGDLTLGAQRIYDLVGGSVVPDSSTSLRALSSAVSNGDDEPAAATSTLASALDSTPTIVPAATARQETTDLLPVTPSASSMLGLDDSNSGEEPVATSSTHWSAPPSSNAPPDVFPRPLSAAMGVLDFFLLSPSTCSTKCPGSSIGALPVVCPSIHTIPSCLLPAILPLSVRAIHSHEMVSATGEELETREAPVSMADMFQITPTPAEISHTFLIVDKVMETSTTLDVYVPHTPELTSVSIASYSMECTNGAASSIASNDTGGDVQPIIFNDEYVDLAIVNVLSVFMKIPCRPVTFSDMSSAIALVVAGLQDTSLITEATSRNGSEDYLEPVLCLIINLFSRSPHSKWPPVSLTGLFLISADVHWELMKMYSVAAVLSWLFIFVVMRKEAMLSSVFQSSRCSTVLLRPCDPGVLMNDMCAKFHWFVIERTQPTLWAMKSPWPPPSSSRSTSCRILNLHRTLDNMQLWGDCQVLKTWELQGSSVLIVIASATGVKAQPKPTVFKWSNPFCFNKQILSECTLDFLLARRTASIVWNYCCLDNLQCYLGSTNWALQKEQRPVLLQMPWQSFKYHWKAVYPMKPCSAIEGRFVEISTDSFSVENELQVLVALRAFLYGLFFIGKTCLQYEHEQWRSPDPVTSLACMDESFSILKDCWSYRHCRVGAVGAPYQSGCRAQTGSFSWRLFARNGRTLE